MRRVKPETDRQASIVKTLEAAGWLVLRIHSGCVRVKRGFMHLAPKGTPDLYVVGWGWLETKTDDGELSDEQAAMHARMARAGELVRVVRTPAEALRAVSGGKIRWGQGA